MLYIGNKIKQNRKIEGSVRVGEERKGWWLWIGIQFEEGASRAKW